VDYNLYVGGDKAEHEIAFNCNKTIVLFCPKRYKQSAPSNVFLNVVRVKFSDHVKYLGVWLNASLKDNDDIQKQVKSLYRTANELRSTLKVLYCSKKYSVSCLLHANCTANTHRLV